MNFQNIPSDPDNSTFHHIAYFLSGYKEHGWSAKAGRAEQRNKTALFCGSVGRLVPHYLGNHRRGICLKVEFYKRTRVSQGAAPTFREDLIATFDDAECTLYGAYDKDRFVRSFVQAFYDANLNYQAVKPMLKGFQSRSPFAFDHTRETYDDLVSRCVLLRDEGYPQGEVEQFFWACKRRFFPDVDTRRPNQPQPAAAPPTPPSPAIQDQAQFDPAVRGRPTGTPGPLAGIIGAIMPQQ